MSKQENILKMRAERLAKVLQKEDSVHDFMEVLVFKLAQEKYAIETIYVKEVYPYKDCTTLPSAPPFIFGLVNVRRKVLSIFDLKVFFDLPAEESQEKKLIILEHHDMELALLTDGVDGIRRIPFNDIQPSLPTLTGARQDFLKGVTPERIILIDAEKLLTSQQIIVNETVE